MHKLICGGYNLDLSPDFGILITKSIAEVRDPENRNSDWSKTITLPGTKINRKAFTHLFDLNTSIRNTSTTNFNPDFNPNLKAPVTHFVDEVQQISGFLRLNQINQVDNDSIEFECTIYGQLADLFTSITEARLSDLDFTEYNHTLTTARITETWDTRIQRNGSNYDNFDSSGNPTGEGYVYALIDDGSYVNYYGDTNASQFYPALYVKDIVDKIFSAAGYSYTSDSFFNEVEFRRLIVPCPTGMKLDQEDIDFNSFQAHSSGYVVTTYPTQVVFPTEISDPSGVYTPATSVFTCAIDGAKYDFTLAVTLSATGLTPATTYAAYFAFRKNGVSIPMGFPTWLTGTSDGFGNVSMSKTVTLANVALNSSDTIEVYLETFTQGGLTPVTLPINATISGDWYGTIKAQTWGLGVSVNFDAFFNGSQTQYDFLKSIFNAYNLYCEPYDDSQDTFYINPRDTFYRNTVRDWSDKLDQSQALEIIPMGELDANPYYFTYTAGEDDENKDYQLAYDRIYGDKKYFVSNDFIKNEKKIEIMFAPSQMYKADGYDKVLTYIARETDGGTGQLRLLYYGGTTGCNNYFIYDNASMTGSGTVRIDYPLTLHIDNPDAPTVDLSYGMPFRVNLPSPLWTNNNLFNAYWKRYIDEITDKNSKIVRGRFHITAADMEKISFRDLYYFERNYFRLNAINDFNPDGDLTECEFLLLNRGLDFTPSTGTGSDGFGDLFPTSDERKGIDGSYLGQVGLVVGRDNGGNGEQSLFVGDRIATAPQARINSAIGSENIYFGPGVERATVINSSEVRAESDELWIFSRKMNIANFEYEVYTETSFPVVANYLTGHHVIFLDMTSGIGTVTLPTAVGNKAHLTFVKVSGDANVATIAADTGETINGNPSKTIAAQYDKFTIVSNNSDWIVIG